MRIAFAAVALTLGVLTGLHYITLHPSVVSALFIGCVIILGQTLSESAADRRRKNSRQDGTR